MRSLPVRQWVLPVPGRLRLVIQRGGKRSTWRCVIFCRSLRKRCMPTVPLRRTQQGSTAHWRTGKRGGRTWSLRWAAVSAMRGVLHEGQTPRPLQEKATRKSCSQSAQRARAKPCAKMPQSRYFLNAWRTWGLELWRSHRPSNCPSLARSSEAS